MSFPRFQQQFGPQGVVDKVHHRLQAGKNVKAKRCFLHLGVHSRGSGVHQHLGVGVAADVAVVVRPRAGDHDHLPRPRIPAGQDDRLRGASGTQHQYLFPCRVDPGPPDQVEETSVVGVVTVYPSLVVEAQEVHVPQPSRDIRQAVAKGEHPFFVGNGHVKSGQIPSAQKGLNLVRCHLEQAVIIDAQFPVDEGGVTVAQFLPQQPVAHHQISL